MILLKMDTLTALLKSSESPEYERMTAEDVVAILGTDSNIGLKKTEVELRYRRFGFNEVPEKKNIPS